MGVCMCRLGYSKAGRKVLGEPKGGLQFRVNREKEKMNGCQDRLHSIEGIKRRFGKNVGRAGGGDERPRTVSGSELIELLLDAPL